jgi:N-acetylglucosaminyl-diphospho-decaprenol L-rhamnosyltransferase
VTINASLSIVIVSYNTRAQTLECLATLWPNTLAGPLEVVVVDNGSSDGSLEAIRAAFPQVVTVDAGDNVGFARGVNLGVAHSTGEKILLLNPDTKVLAGSLEAMMGFAAEHPEYGMYGGKTLRPTGEVEPSSCWGEPTLWSTTSYALGLSTAFKRSTIFDPESLGRWQRDSVREIPIITGCLLLISRIDFDRVGGMDERFFLYGEDAEFSVRARRKGLRPVLVPDAVIIHEVGGSTSNSGKKMAMVMAGKATLFRLAWTPPRARVGIALLQAGAFLRHALGTASGRKNGTWSVVWHTRRDWRDGYPRARRTLFGLDPHTESTTV